MNNLALSVALATAPSSAFNELRERPRFWFPLLLIVLSHRRSDLLVLQRGGHRVAEGRDVQPQPDYPGHVRGEARGGDRRDQPQHDVVGRGDRLP